MAGLKAILLNSFCTVLEAELWLMNKRGNQELSASMFLATNARMVVALAIQVGKYGAMLLRLCF